MPNDAPSANALRVADLPTKKKTTFALQPDAARLRDLAGQFELSDLRKLRFEGQVTPQGKQDWRLEGQLGATVEQPCAVTLAPVVTRIEAPVARYFTAQYITPDAPEAEMDEDDTIEPLGVWIDLEAVMTEALSLEIPAYPRAPDASFGAQVHAPDGADPLTDDAVKPFASLAEFRDKLANKD